MILRDDIITHTRQVEALRAEIRALERDIEESGELPVPRPRLVVPPPEPYVLVVDDEEGMRGLLAIMLRRDQHAVVVTACSIAEATAQLQLQKGPPEAALLDWVLEKTTGEVPTPCVVGSARPCMLAMSLQAQGVPVAIMTGFAPQDTPDLNRFSAEHGITVFRKGEPRKNEPGFLDQAREWFNRQRRLRERRASQ